MPAERTPTETSPLLGSQSNTQSTGTISNIGDVEAGTQQLPARDEEENQTKLASEARPNLKYILPAISIGVCILACYSNRHSANASG